jgi:hypothetical protein
VSENIEHLISVPADLANDVVDEKNVFALQADKSTKTKKKKKKKSNVRKKKSPRDSADATAETAPAQRNKRIQFTYACIVVAAIRHSFAIRRQTATARRHDERVDNVFLVLRIQRIATTRLSHAAFAAA